MKVFWIAGMVFLIGCAPDPGFVAVGQVGATKEPQPVDTPLFTEPDVIGTFYQGDGLGVNLALTLTKDHRFKFTWHGCMGLYDSNEGPWKIEGEGIVLKPEKTNKRGGFRGMGTRFVPVKWGERVYLVEQNRMPAFAAGAHDDPPTGMDIHMGSDFVKVNGKFELPKLSGKPILPKRYMEFYEHGAIKAAVKSVRPDRMVVLDAGSASRLRPGLILGIAAFEDIDLEVLSVTENEAIAQPWYRVGSERAPKVGDKFTSGGRWHEPGSLDEPRYRYLVDVPKRR